MIIDAIIYFARHIAPSGVSRLFSAGSNEPTYQAIKQKIESEALANPLPPVADAMVVGADFDDVKRQVDNIGGDQFYLFLDYGEVSVRVDHVGRTVKVEEMAVTIATRKKRSNADLAMLATLSDECYYRLAELRQRMYADDQRQRPSMRPIGDEVTLAPFSSPELASVGWSMLFRRRLPDDNELRRVK